MHAFFTLQGKFWHFENVELKKFQDVWKMKEEEIAEVVKEVLMADKIIHEQQLGWYWLPPTEDVFVSPHNTKNSGEIQEEPKDQAESTAGSEDEAEDGTKDEVSINASDSTIHIFVYWLTFFLHPCERIPTAVEVIKAYEF